MNKYEDLMLNVGKKAVIAHSEVPGLTDKEGIIKNVIGDQRTGYRYELELPEPLEILKIQTVYPPTFFCDIIDEPIIFKSESPIWDTDGIIYDKSVENKDE